MKEEVKTNIKRKRGILKRRKREKMEKNEEENEYMAEKNKKRRVNILTCME
jgi:hypothetical protein